MRGESIAMTLAAVIKGQVPGVKKQTSLFLDGLGHPQKPLKDFVGYSMLYVHTRREDLLTLICSVVQRHGTIQKCYMSE